MLLYVGTRRSQRPRQTSAPAARKTSRDAVQQPAPAAQRPGICEVADRLLHQRPESHLHAVERPLPVAEAVLGSAVPDRGVPVLAGLGQPRNPQSRMVWPRRRRPAPYPAPTAPAARARGSCRVSRRPATTGHRGHSTPPGPGRCGRGAWRRTARSGWPIPRGPWHPGSEPVDAGCLADLGHLPKALAEVLKGHHERAVGLAVPEVGQLAHEQVHAVAHLSLGDPDHAASTAVRQPVEDNGGHGVQADLQGQRRGAALPARAGWQQRGQATGQPGQHVGRQRRTRAV
jgi:hypothetical protein